MREEVTPTDPLRRVSVALDTAEWAEFESWCKLFGPRVGVLKVGLEAFCRFGERAVATAREHADRVFLDLKLHDIPNTVAGAVGAVRALGVDYVTVHAGGGRPMLRAAVEAAGDELRILAVTLLTHLDRPELDALDLNGPASERVCNWAMLAERCGCFGAVCSPQELTTLRSSVDRNFRLVTPGIRPGGNAADDQRRVATPAIALAAGADLLVIGRPLTRAADPMAALEALREELESAGSEDKHRPVDQ